jgi:hypothetical protein
VNELVKRRDGAPWGDIWPLLAMAAIALLGYVVTHWPR